MWVLFQKTFETFVDLMNREVAPITEARFTRLDDMIQTLETARPGRLREIVRRALSMANPQEIPFNEEGDFIVSFFGFVESNRRTPKQGRQWVNDVLFDLKMSDELMSPLRTFVTDKEFVKLYVRSILGEEYNVPTELIVSNVSDVDATVFPINCVIKPTHMSAQVIIRRDGSPLDRDLMRAWFKSNYYRTTRERNYRYLAPKLIVEPILFGGREVIDYKFFCVEGKAKAFIVQQDTVSHDSIKRQLYTRQGMPLPYEWGFPLPDQPLGPPRNMADMIEVAEQLSRRIGFVRVDLYSDGSQCFVGEITNCQGGANRPFSSLSSEVEFSRLLFSKSDQVAA